MVNKKMLTSNLHRLSSKMAWLRLCQITNESTEIENYYLTESCVGCGTQYIHKTFYFLTMFLSRIISFKSYLEYLVLEPIYKIRPGY